MKPTLKNLHTIDISPGEVGVTVRDGLHWADELERGDLIFLEEKGKVVGEGKVKEIWTGNFAQVPARLVELEHEESSRSYSGLLESMRRAYGLRFEPRSMVTVFAYERIS